MIAVDNRHGHIGPPLDADVSHRHVVILVQYAFDIPRQRLAVHLAAGSPHADKHVNDAIGVHGHYGSVKADRIGTVSISQGSHFAEVHDADHLTRHNHEVAGVDICVEKAIFQNFLDYHASSVYGHLVTIVAGLFHGRDIVDLDTADALEHEYRGVVYSQYTRGTWRRGSLAKLARKRSAFRPSRR